MPIFLNHKNLFVFTILYFSIFFSSEFRFIIQGKHSFNSLMFYFSFSTFEKAPRSEYLSEEFQKSSNILTIKENLVIRNRIKELLEEDAFDE